MMEIRMRSAVIRTAKGYSVEATLDIGQSDALTKAGDVVIAPSGYFGATPEPDKVVAALSAFQIAKLQEHMEKLGAAFPREDA